MTNQEKYMGKLEGKIALITGGNGGIGLETAKQFVNQGAYVFITGGRDPELVAAVKEIGKNVIGVQGKVSNLGDLDRLFAQIKRQKRRLDIVFVNTSVEKHSPLGRITNDGYRSGLDINVKGLFFYGAEGASTAGGWHLDHSQCVRCGHPWEGGERRRKRYKGRGALVRARVDNGLEGAPHSRERREPRPSRHA
jgi:hypothetical protein